MGVVLYSRESGTAGRGAGPLPDREQNDGTRRRKEVRNQQVHRAYGSDKLERLIWAIK